MLKHFYQNETDIPENLKGAYESANGRYELKKLSDNHPTVETNKSLNTTQGQLKAQITELQEKLTIAESKVLGDGKVAVSPQIKELGESALSAGLKKSEIPTLKTAAAELQKQIDGFAGEKQIDEVAQVKKFNGAFKKAAKKEKWKFEKVTVKVDGKDVNDFVKVNEDGTKTSIDAFLTADEFYKDYASSFADTFAGEKQESTGFNFGEQSGQPKSDDLATRMKEKAKAAESTEKPDINARFGRAA